MMRNPLPSSAKGFVALSKQQCLYATARERLATLRGGPRARGAAAQRDLYTTSAQLRRRLAPAAAQRATVLQRDSPLHRSTRAWTRGIKTIQEAETRQKLGPFSVLSAGVFVAAGFGLFFYFRYEKERMERKRVAEATKGVGKPKVGGPFELTDQHGRAWSSENMKGRYALIYFGFSHCPDICPEELDKMANMLDKVSEALPTSAAKNPELVPVFITCDPARDSPPVLETYLKEFHPSIVGLTGTWEQIKAVCKVYRVYFSTPPGVKPGQDYLVDHSIYFYLMDPEGDFVEAIGRQHTAEQGAKLITDHMSDWKGGIQKSQSLP